MKLTKENEKYLRQAIDVDFLTEVWEIEWYTKALMEADAWAKKIDQGILKIREVERLRMTYNR